MKKNIIEAIIFIGSLHFIKSYFRFLLFTRDGDRKCHALLLRENLMNEINLQNKSKF